MTLRLYSMKEMWYKSEHPALETINLRSNSRRLNQKKLLKNSFNFSGSIYLKKLVGNSRPTPHGRGRYSTNKKMRINSYLPQLVVPIKSHDISILFYVLRDINKKLS